MSSGDKAPLTEYAASQAVDGMIVVNANYRMATRFQLKHMLDDGNEVLRWVARHIEEFGGDPHRIVLEHRRHLGDVRARIRAEPESSADAAAGARPRGRAAYRGPVHVPDRVARAWVPAGVRDHLGA
ncbi:alpha/beta hydrolase [Cryobacterium sandaracinum]|uniref:alpha/beta hydrolase n=1 Tax=Cryobacterium sandaracinum TaxID=1259247 RepID=UPI001F53FF16|nr:alpha/beta hydrolase fold domain-containing protein [Cryobacterium sandaracinum]